MNLSFIEIFSAIIVLFAVIDITGSIPIIIGIKDKGGKIEAFKASLVAFIIMAMFLFVGKPLLGLFGVDIASFAIAGAVIIMAPNVPRIIFFSFIFL